MLDSLHYQGSPFFLHLVWNTLHSGLSHCIRLNRTSTLPSPSSPSGNLTTTTMPYHQRPPIEAAVSASPFFRLPLELQTIVYELLLIGEGMILIPSDFLKRKIRGSTTGLVTRGPRKKLFPCKRKGGKDDTIQVRKLEPPDQ